MIPTIGIHRQHRRSRHEREQRSSQPGAGAPVGSPIIVATAVKEYTNGEDIVNHAVQAFAREIGNARVADDGTDFILENTVVAAGTRAEIPSKNDIVGDFSGATAVSMQARIVSAGSAFSSIWLAVGALAEPRNINASDDVFIRVVASGASNPFIPSFLQDSGWSVDRSFMFGKLSNS